MGAQSETVLFSILFEFYVHKKLKNLKFFILKISLELKPSLSL